MNRHLIAVLVALATALSDLHNEGTPYSQFVDITPTSGIHFRHRNGDPDVKNYIFEAKEEVQPFFSDFR